MSSDLKTYKILLDPDQFETLEKLSALGYTSEELAMYFNLDKFNFVAASEDEKSLIYYHISRGKLISKANEEKALLEKTETGDIASSQQMLKIRRLRNFHEFRKHFIYDDETTYHKIEAYIEKGCTDSLSSDEELYLEVLMMMNSMRRKYGRRGTIAFFIKKPFEFSRHRASSLFDRAIQYFYSDIKTDKKALRNLRAEMIMEAAQVVLANASNSKDYEVYTDMLLKASKLQQLDIPEPPDIPKGLYDKPVKLYVLAPEKVGLQQINRNELAKQIDSLEVSEMIKKRLKQDANITDIDFEDILDVQQKEN